MPPQMQRFGGAPNSLASHYQQYPTHSQAHTAGLPPPTHSLGANPGFMNANSMSNPFAVNGNALSVGNFGGSGLGMPGGTGLASQAAQMSFAGASVQQQAHNGMGEQGARNMANKGRIKDVWKGNLHEEMATLRNLVEKYPYIAMDTEFPGVVARPMGAFNGKSDYHYQCMRCNVDLLNLIQLGITLFNKDGESPPAIMDDNELGPTGRKYGQQTIPHTWQFNFKFSLETDMYAEASVEALRIAGLNFERLETDGIDPLEFGALLISSGLVCDEDVRWISFHGGYDFGYLTKVLLCLELPDDETQFDRFMKKFFPSIYDIKYLMKFAIRQNQMGALTPLDQSTIDTLAKFDQKQSLENLGEALKVKRQGNAHQAGSDSLLTGKAFFKMREKIFKGDISDEHIGRVWGLGLPDNNATQSTPQHYHQQLQENATPTQNGTTYNNGTPSTPNTSNAGLVSTPAHNNNGGGIGPLTPGGGGGVFGAFQFGNK